MVRSNWIGLVVAALCLSVGAVAWAQEKPRLRGGAGNTGVGAFAPGDWGVVSGQVENPDNQPANVLLVHHFDHSPQLQFAAKVWLPAKSRRRVIVPLRPSEQDLAGASAAVKSFPTTTLLYDENQVQLGREAGLLPAVRSDPVVAAMKDSSDGDPVDMLSVLRKAAGAGRATLSLTPREMPVMPAGYQVADALMIGRGRIEADAAQLLALRQWLLTGGKLWVLAERVDHDAMRRLLGEDWTLEVVERVTTTAGTIQGKAGKHSFETDDPIRIVRSVAPGMTPMLSIGGYPALLHKRIGRGELYVTTVGPRGWIGPDESSTPVLAALNGFLESAPDRSPVPAQKYQPIIQQQIGYRIMSRVPVAGVLGSFCGLLLIAGLWLQRRGRLELIGPVGAGIAVVASVILLAMGSLHRRDVPLTVASGQTVIVVPSQQHAVVSGLMSIFSPQQVEDAQLQATRGGIVWSDLSRGRSSSPLRTVWTDIDRWYWTGFSLPSGAMVDAEFVKSEWLTQPVSAQMTLGEAGVEVMLQPGQFEGLTDAVLAIGPRPTPMQHVGGNRYVTSDQTDGGEFVVASGLLTQEQRRHEQVYRAMFSQRDFPEQPMLMAWARPMPLGLQFPEGAAHRDIALVGVPVTFDRPAAGARVRLPSQMMDWAPARGPGGVSSITLYDPNAREWISPLSGPKTILLRFELPPGIAPATVEGGSLVLDLQAPGVPIEAVAVHKNKLVTLASAGGALGRLELELPDHPALDPDARGGVTVGFKIEAGHETDWTLTDVRLNLDLLIEPANP